MASKKRQAQKEAEKLQEDVRHAEAEILPILGKYNLSMTVLYRHKASGSSPVEASVGFVRVPDIKVGEDKSTK